MRAHPDGEIFLSLFKSPDSVITPAELLAKIGDCRGRSPNRDTRAADAGQAAVAVESGKWKTAGFRRACYKRLHAAFCRLADASRHWHPWAQTLRASTPTRTRAPPRDPDRRPRLVPHRVAMLAQPHPLRPRATPRTATPHHRHHPQPVGPSARPRRHPADAPLSPNGRPARAERAALDSQPPTAQPRRLTQDVLSGGPILRRRCVPQAAHGRSTTRPLGCLWQTDSASG